MEVAYSEALNSVPGGVGIGAGISPLNRLETRNWDLLADLPSLGRTTPLNSLRDRLRQLTGRQHVFFAPSCRAALAQVLSLLPQQEVVIPAYSCEAVKVALQVARKKIICADVAPRSVNSTSAEFEKHAKAGRVIVPTHLFGIPTDIENICELAKDRGCVTIEDSAAAFGAKHRGRFLGTFADVGIYSFERSKRFPAFRGAAIVLNNDNLISPQKLADAEWFGARDVPPLQEIASAMFYNVATTPWIYQKFVVPHQLAKYAKFTPQAEETPEKAVQSRFFSRKFHPYQAALVLRMLARMRNIEEKIGRLVRIYRDALRDTPIVTFLPAEAEYGEMLRFPVVIPEMKRSEVLRSALRQGLFLETNFETLLSVGLSADRFPNAAWVAQNVILLPLYSSLSEKAALRVAQEIIRISLRPDRASSPGNELLECRAS